MAIIISCNGSPLFLCKLMRTRPLRLLMSFCLRKLISALLIAAIGPDARYTSDVFWMRVI